MSYNATVFKVMIASPNDVDEERQIIRECVHEWNAIHSEQTNVVLLPVGWETHSSPVMGARPQEIINKQVLSDCDLLVAAFWTRLGSPTGKAASGTVEEINEHLDAGKPSMIYFSSAPVNLNNVDPKQYKALRGFKEDCFAKGLVQEYSSFSDFRNKFQRQLAQTIHRHFKHLEPIEKLFTLGEEESKLSREAVILLLTTSEQGHLLVSKTQEGTRIYASETEFIEQGDHRSEALWLGAVDELYCNALIRIDRPDCYSVTREGYHLVDRIKERL